MGRSSSKYGKRLIPATTWMSRRAAVQSSIRNEKGAHVQQIRKKRDETHLDLSHPTDQAVTPVAARYYVYGIVEANKRSSFGMSMMEGAPADIFTICHNQLAAVVSNVHVPILDATKENIFAHENVVERVMKTNTIIPMSFGTIFKTTADIQAMLQGVYDCLCEVLRKLEGKIEFGLRVTWDRDGVVARLRRQNEEIRLLDSELRKKGLHSTYFARMQLARMIEAALRERSAEIVHQIYKALRPVCVASRDNKPIGEMMIMNAAFLLERKRANQFDQILHRISKNYHDLVDFKYSGPWPAYNFVSIRLKLERAKAA